MVLRIVGYYCRLIEWLIALCLAAMVVMVFGNVFFRYAFNSGFTVSEELSSWLLVWMPFLRPLVALRETARLGTDMRVSDFCQLGTRLCIGIFLFAWCYCMGLFF